MELKEREQYIDIVCGRIGKTALYIRDLLEEQSKLNSYSKDLRVIEKFDIEEKKNMVSLTNALLTVDDNYREDGNGLSRMNYGIFQNYVKEIHQDIKAFQMLESNYENRKFEKIQRKKERDQLELKKEKRKEINLFLKLEGISIAIMFCFTIFLFLLWNKKYDFSLGLPFFFLFVITGGIVLILYQIFSYVKKQRIEDEKKEEYFGVLEKEEQIQQFREDLQVEELCLKYSVDDCEELENHLQVFQLQKSFVAENSLFVVQLGLNEFLRRKGVENPQFFIHFPMCFIKESDFLKVKLYVENRKQDLENNVYYQIMGQKEDIEKMRQFANEYPVLREQIETTLGGYGIAI